MVVSYRNSTSNHNRESVTRLATPVVSYRNSTSNHNTVDNLKKQIPLYLIEILHQTTTRLVYHCRIGRLYLIEILHQTTTNGCPNVIVHGCILSKFYIKPQPALVGTSGTTVVSYRNSTSNHNSEFVTSLATPVVSYRNSTSNHNAGQFSTGIGEVVSYRNSTSNHNTPDRDGKS